MVLSTDLSEPVATRGETLRVVVLGGSDAQSGIVKDHTRQIPIEGNNDSWRLLPDDVRWSRCHLSPSYFRQGRRWTFAPDDVILNLISDPDQNPKTLRVAERVTASHRHRLVNDPRRLLKTRRDDIARALQGTTWLHVPTVMRLRNPTLPRLRLRMEAEGFSFPAIVRPVGSQTGDIVGVFRRPEDLGARFDAMTGEYYFTEFLDLRWSDGLYRKMRLFNIGGETILRHRLISDGWNVHGQMARSGIMLERDELRDEERRHMEGEGDAGPVMDRARETMSEVVRRLGLDYFGMDFGPREDGGFVLFEANATMNIVPTSADPRYDYTRGTLDLAAAALKRLLRRRAGPIGRD